jgi:RimJ/RimL family protein N-acetyltransferase
MDIDVSRLVLRRPVDFDAEQILALALDPAVRRWNPIRTVEDVDTARSWCRQNADWSVGDHATWVVLDKSSTLVATCALYDISLTEATAGIGYRVSPTARGRGVARSCVNAVTRWAFEEYHLARVQLAHSVENDASCHVALASGFAPEGTLRSSYVDIEHVRHDEHIHGRVVGDPAPDGVLPVRLEP